MSDENESSEGNPAEEALAPVRSLLTVTPVKTGYQQVADQIRSLIFSRDLVPGDRLPSETEMTVAFGVSRSTIREALRVLSSTNLTYTLRGVAGGTFVADSDPESISTFLGTQFALLSGQQRVTGNELLEARHLLEVPAAGLAALRRSEDEVLAMRQSIADRRAKSDRRQSFDRNESFHSLITQASGNKLLHVVTTPLFAVIKGRFLDDNVDKNFFDHTDKDHDEIPAYIASQDEAGARQAMSEHLDRLAILYQATGIS